MASAPEAAEIVADKNAAEQRELDEAKRVLDERMRAANPAPASARGTPPLLQRPHCPLGLERCPLRTESLQDFLRDASVLSKIPTKEFQKLMSASERHCTLYTHAAKGVSGSRPDLTRVDLHECSHSVPMCPLLFRSWVASEEVNRQLSYRLKIKGITDSDSEKIATQLFSGLDGFISAAPE